MWLNLYVLVNSLNKSEVYRDPLSVNKVCGIPLRPKCCFVACTKAADWRKGMRSIS